MLEEFVKTVFKNLLKKDYSHLELPSNMYAKIVRRKETGNYYEYNLKILDENKQIDDKFPEIPNIKSKHNFQIGDNVIVLLLFGRIEPYIIGEVL